MANLQKLNCLMCGTVSDSTCQASASRLKAKVLVQGEYTTGWTGSGASKSDKKVEKLSMVGVNGGKFPAIRQHLQENIAGVYKDMDVSFDAFPEEGKVDPLAYKTAIDKLSKGDAVIIFTPDNTHYDIALYAIERGLHVLVTKPAVQQLKHHNALIAAAKKHGVVCFVEHHKRRVPPCPFDPVYSDAKARAQTLGEFNFFSAWMSQPKSQLETFRAWAGKDSDIRHAHFPPLPHTHPYSPLPTSYYLSSHHIDIHCWMMQGRAVPTRVVASAAAGIATSPPYNCVPQTEDTITLLVDWQSLSSAAHRGTAVYTASWTHPLKTGVHSAQHWYYMAEKGDISVDQAHRGYDVTVDDTGKSWFNPFYMKYSPSESGHFDGQRGYGYVSIEKFVDAARSVNAGLAKPEEFDAHGLPTIANTVATTAILHAGRISLDEKRPVVIKTSGGQYSLE
ncbi:NAD P-binding protein [Gloeophyllum trabeum ATCC 11539]|uniref:NAD P-binding protein n=1 Tax=Gloeophyllum trabeum (strain ATCC 11539 / FP-39264 / Madison 617) TaxID=670483 RepID=S7QMS5_GLOTA|nr:NAD P-binding protein [Gloeophyllum trabeum ATCC 11539]EPQ60871.1 NAD P-binding protein [Gloeophyllum trabeum ATCC 11539]